MPKRAGETENLPPVHNFQSNPDSSVWNKKAKVEEKADADSDSDDEVNVEAEPEYRSATLPVTDGDHKLHVCVYRMPKPVKVIFYLDEGCMITTFKPLRIILMLS